MIERQQLKKKYSNELMVKMLRIGRQQFFQTWLFYFSGADKYGRSVGQPQGEVGDRIIFSQDEEFSMSIEFSPEWVGPNVCSVAVCAVAVCPASAEFLTERHVNIDRDVLVS